MTCPYCAIIPDHILEHLQQSKNPDIADAANATRLSSQAFRAAARLASSSSVAHARVTPGLRRKVFDCNNTTDLSARGPVRNEELPAGDDQASNRAFDFSGITWNFFKTLLGRESIDNRGMMITSSVHYDVKYDNAFWNGYQMVYGDGDGVVFTDLTKALDVVAHELTHGITQYTAELAYEGQSGALNESFSDIFGVLVRQWHQNQGNPLLANWLIGPDIMVQVTATRRGLRDIANPGTAFIDDPLMGTDQQRAHMNQYLNTQQDNGGVHFNSGIPNRAFYLAATKIGGPAWETAGRIWYKTLTERLRANADFRKAAFETISVARDFYAADRTIAWNVAQAWVEVGVLTNADLDAIRLSAPA